MLLVQRLILNSKNPLVLIKEQSLLLNVGPSIELKSFNCPSNFFLSLDHHQNVRISQHFPSAGLQEFESKDVLQNKLAAKMICPQPLRRKIIQLFCILVQYFIYQNIARS